MTDAGDLDAHVAKVSKVFWDGLVSLAADYPQAFAPPRGRGLMLGLPVREPFQAKSFADAARIEKKLLINAAGSNTILATLNGQSVAANPASVTVTPAAPSLSASTASQRLDARRVLAAYGEPVDPATLAACEKLRRLHLTVWYNLYAERLPELRPRAAELLALWPPP